MNSIRRAWQSVAKLFSTNYDLRQSSIDPYDLLNPNSIVLDVGSGLARGDYSFVQEKQGRRSMTIVRLDFDRASNPSVIADAHALPLQRESVDCVVCVSTLEYLQRPRGAVDEMYRVLKPGAYIYLSAPFVFPHHPPPEDFYRFSMSGMRMLAGRFEEIQVGYSRGPASTFCHILVHFLAVVLCFNSKRAYGILVDLFKAGLFWIKYLDRWIGHFTVADVLHGSAFFLGKKPLGCEELRGRSGEAARRPLRADAAALELGALETAESRR
jgi:ubiquinone/menaquinone biosynthesis C-methylase UbiE